MKTRKQPKRQARRSRVKADVQIKQPKVKKQIRPKTQSTFCSSSRPAQLWKNCESRRANMALNKHVWTRAEGDCLLKEAHRLFSRIGEQEFKKNKRKFYSQLAEIMNSKWSLETGYVALTDVKVMTKLKNYEKAWKKGSPAVMGDSLQFHLLSEEEESSFFSGSGATSSDSVGMSKLETKRKYTTPTDITMALQYMKEHGCTNVEYYTRALQDKDCLMGFCGLKSYKQRKEFLDDVLAAGLVQPPSCELANTLPVLPAGANCKLHLNRE